MSQAMHAGGQTQGNGTAAPTPSSHARLFLALWPSPATRARIVSWRDAGTFPSGAALVPPEKLHVTLHFIGAVPRADLPRVIAGLSVEPDAFDIRFGVARHWPGGLAVLEPHRVPSGLHALHGQLAQRLRDLHLRVEARAYRPHVTLARKAQGADLPAHDPDLRWRSRGYALVESGPGQGHAYEVVQRYGSASAPLRVTTRTASTAA